MKSDVIQVTSGGAGIDAALGQAEAVAVFKSLSAKDTIHLRLLTEEMMGMMQAITGECNSYFWIEDSDSLFSLHLKAKAAMNSKMRKKLLSASSSGKNASAKGVMGKIRDVFERMLEPYDDSISDFYAAGMVFPSTEVENLSTAAGVWSLNKYRSTVEEGHAPNEDWDELEQSIIANIADEVEIGIVDKTVELTVYKRF